MSGRVQVKGKSKKEKKDNNKGLISGLRQGHSKPVRPWERALWIAVLIVTVLIVHDIYVKYGRIRGLYNQIAEVDRLIEVGQIENQWLLLEREFRQSDAFIERYAREELGWLRPGDRFLVFP